MEMKLNNVIDKDDFFSLEFQIEPFNFVTSYREPNTVNAFMQSNPGRVVEDKHSCDTVRLDIHKATANCIGCWLITDKGLTLTPFDIVMDEDKRQKLCKELMDDSLSVYVTELQQKSFVERRGFEQEFLKNYWFKNAKKLDSTLQEFLGMSREEYNSWNDGRLRLYDGSYHEMEKSVFCLPDIAVDKIRNEIAHPLPRSEMAFSNDVNMLLPVGQRCFVSINDDAKLAYVYDGGDDVLAVVSHNEIMYREDFAELMKDAGIEATEVNFDKVWKTFRSSKLSQGTLKDRVLSAINKNMWPSFSGYLEYKKNEQKIVSINFGNIISELEKKNLKLCFVGGTHEWGLSLEDNENNLYRIEPFFDQAWLPKLIENGAVVKFEQVDKSIPELNVESWEKRIMDVAKVKNYIETVFAIEHPTIAKNVLDAYNIEKKPLDAVIQNASEQCSERVASSSEVRSEKTNFQL